MSVCRLIILLAQDQVRFGRYHHEYAARICRVIADQYQSDGYTEALGFSPESLSC